METDIRYGMTVVTRDGRRIGRVDRIFVDECCRDLLAFSVQQYLLTPAERIVPRSEIDRVDADGALVLKIDSATADRLDEYVATATREAGARRQERQAERREAGFDIALRRMTPRRAGAIDTSIVLDKGAPVFNESGRKLGALDRVTIDSQGAITRLMVRTGIFGREEVMLEPVAAVAAFEAPSSPVVEERAGVAPESAQAVDEPLTEARPLVGAASSARSIAGVDDEFAEALATIGITTAATLLERGATRAGREEIAGLIGTTASRVLEWVNHADLMRVDGVTDTIARLLEDAGVDTVPELANRNPQRLHARLVETAAGQDAAVPDADVVAGWVAQAKELGRVITY